MTIMTFDPHRGWYNPNPDILSRPFRPDAPLRAAEITRAKTHTRLTEMSDLQLVDVARSRGAGAIAAQHELRRRNGLPG